MLLPTGTPRLVRGRNAAFVDPAALATCAPACGATFRRSDQWRPGPAPSAADRAIIAGTKGARGVARPPQCRARTELEEFFDLSIDPLSILGFDGAFKRVNASFVRLLGYPRPELFSRTALDILHPDDVEAAREALAHLAEGRDLVRVRGPRHLRRRLRAVAPVEYAVDAERGVVFTSDGTQPSSGWSTPSCARRGARSRQVATSCTCSRTSRRRCAEWRCSSRGRRPPARSSRPSLRRSGCSSMPTLRHCTSSRVTARRRRRQLERRGGPMLPIGTRFPLDGDSLAARISRPARQREWTATPRRGSVRQRTSHGVCACARRSGRRSSSGGSSGAR